jgi:hypothetical protein
VMIVRSQRLNRLAPAGLRGLGVNAADPMWTSVVRVQWPGRIRPAGHSGPDGITGGSDPADVEDRLPTAFRWSGAR